MPDYDLGRAHGTIEIDYDGKGVNAATADMRRAEAANDDMDKSLTRSQKSMTETQKTYESTGRSAEGYAARVRDVERASSDADRAEKVYRATLLNSKSTTEDILKAQNSLTEARKKQVQAVNAERDAHQALSKEMNLGQRAVHALSDVIPTLQKNLERLANVEENTTQKTTKLGRGLGGLAKLTAALGGEVDGVSGGLELASKAVDKMGNSAQNSAGHVRSFIGHIAGLEGAVGKVGGLALGGLSVGALGGLAGAGATQGIVEVADAVRQLSGLLGVLPAAAAGVGLSMGTLKIAFHGVGQALKDMMADDPKKFLDDIKEMGPVTAQALLGVAQFRNQIKAGGAAIQDSFFKQIAGDIQPLITTFMPAVVQGMTQIASVMGQTAHQFATLLEQPATMQAFQQFVSNLSAGMQALQPALAPLLDIFTRLTTVGSSFFSEIGGRITQMLGFFDQIISKAEASGQLQAWIQSGIDAFSHLINIAYSFGAAFNNIMNLADKFGDGGLLGFLDKVTQQLNAWTQSAAGQQALASFFTTLKTATDALLPILPQILNGFTALASALVQLGVATAPGQQSFFVVLSATLQNLAPIITQMAPAVNQFLIGLAHAMSELMQQVGPQLPAIFEGLANAFTALLPQLGPLVQIFIELAEQVGPQLPKLFGDITALIEASLPYWPIIIGFVRDFVSILTWFIGAGKNVINWFTDFLGGVRNFITQIPTVFGQIKDTITNFFKNLPDEALHWGENLIKNFIEGIKNTASALPGPLGTIGRTIVNFLSTNSPANDGPLHDVSPNVMGAKIVRNMAAGMTQTIPSITAAAHRTAAAAAAALGGAAASAAGTGASIAAAGGASGSSTAGAPAAGGSDSNNAALLPDNIATADVSILRAFEKHKFDPNRGLKGLAASLGQALQVAQGGFNLLNQNVVQPMFQALGLVPGAKAPSWRKLTPKEQAEHLRDQATKSAAGADPTWADALGAGSPGAANGMQQLPLGLTANSSKEDIQKAIIAAGKARGLNDGAIQTALAVAAAESGFNASSPTQTQGGHPVGGLYQQGPAFGTVDQALDPNHAINAFYNQFAQQLQKNPNDPLLAAVLTQNPQLGSAAAGSDYMKAVQNKLGLAGSILGAPGNKDIKGPTWAQIAPGSKNWFTGEPNAPTAAAPGAGGLIDARSLPEGLAPTKNLSPNAELLNRAVTAMFGAEIRALGGSIGGWRAGDSGSNEHSTGGALDIMVGPGGQQSAASKALGDRINAFVQQNAKAFGLNWSIWNDRIQNAGEASTPYTPLAGDGNTVTGRHEDHVHAYTGPSALGGPGTATQGTGLFAAPGGLPAGPIPVSAQTGSGDPSGGLVLANGKTIDQMTANTDKSAAANQALLQAYLQGNPALAAQIQAGQTPGASDQAVLGALNGIGRTIEGLKTQDAVGNKATIDALSETQSQIASQNGYTSQQSSLQQAQSAISGIGNAVTGAFQVAQGVLDAMSATQDIADRLVYGVANTEDVMKLIDDGQKYISLAADIANETGNVLNAAGGIAGAAGSAGDEFGGGAPGAALSMAGSIAQLVGGALQGVNMAIDYGQEIYEIAMNYVGKFMSYLAAGPNGTPLMGDVQFMLDTNTAQLLTSSLDNPQNQNSLPINSFLQGLYGIGKYGNGSNAETTAFRDLNVYGSPGMSASDLIGESMWQVSTGGVSNGVGAYAAANF